MIPRFRTACLVVGPLYVLVGASILIRGAATAMADYGVPAQTLASPHYVDAISWVYLHTIVLGVVIGLVGWFAREPELKLWFSRAIVAAHVIYVALDFGHSSLGDGLYAGDASIVPGVMGVVFVLLFIGPSIRRERPSETKAEQA